MTIREMKGTFDALLGKEVRLRFESDPKKVYEGKLLRSEKEGFPYKLRVRSGNACGWLVPSPSMRVAELSAL